MAAPASSPWVGLQPYDEEHRAFFHGRERDERVVAANLRARRLTLLYGSAGIGKSSLLLAGVVPTVREKQAVLLFRDWQGSSFRDELRSACVALAREHGHELDADEPLDELLRATARAAGKPVLVVFDQFEEYFVAHAPAVDGVGFEPELARAVNRSDVDARFLISLREDALGAMDRFQTRIPNLLGNLIRLEHLTADAAERAIRESLAAWNEQHDTNVEIEDELVRALLPDVSPHAQASLVGSAGGDAPDNAVEAPFLQLVLERLWEVERGDGNNVLRLETYRRLGGAAGIVGAHFGAILARLTPEQRDLCSRFFDRLVTPSGGKITYPLEDLKKVAGELAPQVSSTLKALQDARILREVDAGGQKAVVIYHDVLAPTILDWQAWIVRQRERQKELRRLKRRIAQVAVVALAVVAGIAYVAYSNWVDTRPWATLSDLGTGQVFHLKGAQVVIGRTVKGQKADVSFTERQVSRVHLIVYRDGRAIDVRSSNGTTVDGRFLRYGLGWRQLKPGDVLVIGGFAVVRYERIHYPFWHIWTPSTAKPRVLGGWALLVAGRHVTALPSYRRTTFLSVAHGVVTASASRTGALAAVSPASGGYLVFKDLADGIRTQIQCANANGESYPVYVLGDGKAYPVPGNCVALLRGHRAQVVPRLR